MTSISETRRDSGPDRPWHVGRLPRRNGECRLWLVPPVDDGDLDFETLLSVLDYNDDEFVSICHKNGQDDLSAAVMRPADVAAHIAGLPENHDFYFGVNPIAEQVRSRPGAKGKADDVTRLAGLWADLDFKDGGCGSEATARAVIDELSAVLGTPPTIIVNTGGGLHPYWPISDGGRG